MAFEAKRCRHRIRSDPDRRGTRPHVRGRGRAVRAAATARFRSAPVPGRSTPPLPLDRGLDFGHVTVGPRRPAASPPEQRSRERPHPSSCPPRTRLSTAARRSGTASSRSPRRALSRTAESGGRISRPSQLDTETNGGVAQKHSGANDGEAACSGCRRSRLRPSTCATPLDHR
jgi:hypothetical protein